ncbi:MAG TPA: NUDIX domain-containing protein [Flavipsychrobacter sp.]
MKISAGILLYRQVSKELQVFLVHPGGPFWKHKDEGAWSIPKGETEGKTELLAVARKEFQEETGTAIDGDFTALQPVKLKSGKVIHAFTIEGDIDADTIRSNTFPLEWPPRSGKTIQVPEVDKAGWFTVAEARKKMNPAQAAMLDELLHILEAKPAK